MADELIDRFDILGYMLVEPSARKCIRCGELEIEQESPEWESGHAVSHVDCPSCGLVWLEHYYLQKVEILGEHGKVVEECTLPGADGQEEEKDPVVEELKLLNTTLISINNTIVEKGTVQERIRQLKKGGTAIRGDVTLYNTSDVDDHLKRVDELVRRASIAYWFMVSRIPAKSGYIEPLKPAIEAVTGEELRRE